MKISYNRRKLANGAKLFITMEHPMVLGKQSVINQLTPFVPCKHALADKLFQQENLVEIYPVKSF